MSCTKEEIERKRLLALQKRQNKVENSAVQVLNNRQVASPLKVVNQAQSKIAFRSISPSTSYQSKATGSYKLGHASESSFHPYLKPVKNGKTDNLSSVPSKVVAGTVYLISEDRFEVNPSEFCTPLVNIFKSLPTRSYDGNSRLWNFSLDDYHELMLKVAPLAPHVVLGPLPPYVLRIIRETNSVEPQDVDLTPVETKLRTKLMPFQEEGVRFGIAKRGRCMIADDMGLGKTFQALAIASFYRHNWPMLIVTTSSMRETWQSKIHELLPSVPMMNIVTLSSSKDSQLVSDKQTEVVIVSYKITTMHTQLLKSKKFGVVVVDESHYLKSHKAQCTIALTAITKQASRVLLLSGTPALSRPAELYTQLSLIEPHAFSGYVEFGKRYCAGKLSNFGWDMTGQSNLAELQILLQKKFLIRRTKEQVLTKLEEKTRESVILDPTLLEVTQEDQNGLTQMAQNYMKTKSNERHAALLTFFSETARVKIPAICKYIRQLLRDEKHKFLVFAHHKNVMEAISLTLDELAVHYICIAGATPSASRADLVDKFQFSESCRCAVLSITAANSGLTLTAANLVLFAELHWNPGILTQAESRAHRIGQQGGVCVRYLLANGTADDYIWPMLQSKLNVLNEVGLSKDTFEGTTSKLQESKNNIVQYLSPSTSRNRNDFIPGTNIRKSSHSKATANCNQEIKQPNHKDSLLKNSYVHSKLLDSTLESLDHREVDSIRGALEHSEIDSTFEGLDHRLFESEEWNDVDKSFLEDNEGDNLLANLNF